jgi:hypothetical protein
MHTSPAWSRWTADLASRGLTVLPQSHLVPVDMWLLGPAGELLHLTGRGTTLRLRRYVESDLTGLLLRAECDCKSHREAGATARVALRPDAVPLASVAFDGAALRGWTGVHAAALRPAELAPLLDVLLDVLLAEVVGDVVPDLGVPRAVGAAAAAV